jgi:GNAT superfamily N-acetyltransferase
MHALDVREVTHDDVPDALALVTEVLAEFGLAFGVGSATDDQLPGLPASYVDGGGRFWIARHAGRLVGTCGVYPVAPKVFELRKMYVRSTARGLGVGRLLLELAIAWTRAHGGTHVVLDTIEEMTQAIVFYERNGFVRDDAQRRSSRCTRGYTLALRR